MSNLVDLDAYRTHEKLKEGWGFAITPLGTKGPPVGNYQYLLVGDFDVSLVTRVKDRGQKTRYQIRIPSGFEFDGASVPRAFWRLLPPVAGVHLRAALAHDVLYVDKMCWKNGDYAAITKEEADWIFRQLMLEDGVTPWLAKAAYSAVAAFGGSTWDT